MVKPSLAMLEKQLLLAKEPPLIPNDRRKHHKEDPLSHRIIEKRRRDRMNNCLADLSRLIPPDYMKKGRGRIEKTEIIEMAIKHMKHLQTHPCTDGVCRNGAEEQKSSFSEHYRLGFHECLSETMHFLVEVEGYFAGDSLCVQLMSHLNRHCDNILKSESLRAQLEFPKEERMGGMEEKFLVDSQPQSVHQSSCDNMSETTSGRCSQPSNELSPTPSQSSCEKVSESSGLVTYKFKNNIQRRFESAAKRARQVSSETGSLPSPGGGGSVPIFALSPRGSYYLPLTIDYTLLSTQISSSEPVEEASLVLHPVTISVNFQPPRGRLLSKEMLENT